MSAQIPETILRLTDEGLTITDFDREVYPEVTEDVVAAAAALGAN